jgi:hypothetical protein
MINETGNTENTNFADEGGPSSYETSGSSSSRIGQVKDLGKKSLEPLVGVLSRHKGDFSPYLDALTKALQSGVQSLQGEESSDAEKFIAQYLTDGADWLGQWKDKLHVNSPDEFMSLLEEEGKKHPAILFGASYFAGLILGRFGRHLGKTMRSSTENIH